MSSDAYKYIQDAIERINAGEVSSQEGSHVTGVFGKAAQKYERLLRQKLRHVLNVCGIDYDNVIRVRINGEPPLEKLTLGMIAKCFDNIHSEFPHCLKKYFVSKSNQFTFIDDMKAVNKTWIHVKHGDGISSDEAVEQLRIMKRTLHAIKANCIR